MRRVGARRGAVAKLAVCATLGLWPAAVAAQPISAATTEPSAGSSETPASDSDGTEATVGAEPEPIEPVATAPDESGAESRSVHAAEPSSDAVSGADESAPPGVRVHVRARRAGVEAHVRLGSHVVTTDGISRVADDYTLLCAPAPCDADVPSGVHLFAVSGPSGRPLPVHDVDLAAGLEHTLEIDLDDRSGWRTFGTVAALLVGAPGLVVLLVSLVGPAIDRGPIDAVFVASGASLTALGIAAVPLAAWGDTRVVEIVDPDVTAH